MEIRIGGKKSKSKKIKLSDISRYFSDWWGKAYRAIFVLLMLLSMLAGISLWYYSLYSPIMSEQEKDNYRIIKDRSVKFLEKDFNDVIKSIEEKELEYSRTFDSKRDIFK